jgi:putative membrane-bound dehydrogenase-like protein
MKPRLCLLCVAVVLLVGARSGAQVPPEKAETTFQLADGLEMKLWASEPLFTNPTSMDIDHLGRVWVCEAVNYRCTLHRRPDYRKEGDRIVILADTTGKGGAGRATVFYQGPDLRAPLGIAVAKDPSGPGWKVFVCQSPDILLFEDKDGDGKADGPPTKLLSGFGGFDHDHGVHGILIGPDMKLYFSVGDQGVHGLQSSDGKGRKWESNDTDCRAGTIWRCDLDGRNLELIAHNFRNEYEPCVDSFGTVFVSDNDDDGSQQTRICYVMPGGDYGYHPRGPGQSHWHEEQPGVVPKILRTYFGSPTGMCVYEGTLLPRKYWGQLLHTDAGPRHVRCYHLKPKGAGYAVEREDMVTSTDNWFRPSDICVAPDGSVFVADWYDPGVGGHGMGDITRGRIYRLAPKGNLPNVPKVDLSGREGILAGLSSPNQAVRYMATAKLFASQDKKGLARWLVRMSEDDESRPWVRARAAWVGAELAQEHGLMFAPFMTALRDDDHRLRCLALRLPLAGPLFVECVSSEDPSLVAIAQRILKDPSPQLRREALLLLRGADPVKARSAIYALAKQYDGNDRFCLEAIGIAVGHYDKARRDVILADFDKEFPEWNDKVADLVWELRPPCMMRTLGRRLTDPTLIPQQRARVLDILAASDDPGAGKVLLGLLHEDLPAVVRARVLDNLEKFLPNRWAGLRDAGELTGAIDSLLARPDGREAALRLIAAAGRVSAIPRVRELALDPKTAEGTRHEAVRTLGKLTAAEAIDALLPLAAATGPLGSGARDALGTLAARLAGAAGNKALEPLQAAVRDGKAAPQVRVEAATALAGTRPGSVWLLRAAQEQQLDPTVRHEIARLLRNSPYPDLRNRALIAFPPPRRLDPKKLPTPAALAARRGDPQRGQQLLAASINSDLQCLKCHTVRGVGGQVGPELSMIGKKASKENLFESILYPSKAVPDQYVTWQIETAKGLQQVGLLVEETAEGLTLRDANGKDTLIAKKDVASRTKSLKSLMPEDLVAYMTADDLVDLVACLYELRTPALTVDAWHISGRFDNGVGDAGLDEVFGPEKSVDLKATYRGKAGEVRWRTVRPDARGYVDLAAFFAPDSDETVSYLYQEIESPQDQEATLLLGTDDGCKLWVNGELVHTSRIHRPAAPAQDTVHLQLRRGVNRVLLKINNGNGAYGFYFTLLAEQELKRATGR